MAIYMLAIVYDWFFINSVNGQNNIISCNSYFDCFNDVLTTGYCDEIIVNGDCYDCDELTANCYDALGRSIHCTENIYLEGAYTAYNLPLVKTDTEIIHCKGSKSCEFTLIESVTKNVLCYAASACSNAIIKAHNIVTCNSDQSCASANITARYITADGAYSINNSSITLVDRNDGLTVGMSLRGHFAGFGGKVRCLHTNCTIYCYGNSCFMLYIECIDSCNIHIITNSNCTVQPIRNLSHFAFEGYSLTHDSAVITSYTHYRCNEASTDYKYNVYQQLKESDDILITSNEYIYGGPICCQGSESCYGINNISLNNEIPYQIICSGSDSCRYIRGSLGGIHNNGPIYCEGFRSCYGSNIVTTNDVYCMAMYACFQSDIRKAANVYCTAYQSCYSTDIYSSGALNVYVLSGSDDNINIYCSEGDFCYIECGSHNGCANVNVYCDGICEILCESEFQCGAELCPNLITQNPTQAPTSSPSPSPTPSPTVPSVSPTFHPTTDPTAEPTHNPTMEPTFQPTLDPTTTPIIATTGHELSTSTTTVLFKQQIRLDDITLFVTVGVLALALILMLWSVIYLFRSNIMQRTKQIGTATMFQTLKEFGLIERTALIISCIDIITDFVFCLELINSDDGVLINIFGWILCATSLAGSIIFYIKFILSKKLIGHQTVRLKQQLESMVNRDSKASQALINEIRIRRMDIEVVSLLNACIEDCPQSLIAMIIVTSDALQWSPIALFKLCLSVLSFAMKICQIILAKYGCKDPDDLYTTQTAYTVNTQNTPTEDISNSMNNENVEAVELVE